jgi:ubiquitin C-terminal hydrolase
LENIGNTWYFNVILQWLFHLKGFNDIFIDGSFTRMLNKSQKSNLWEAYAELLKKTREAKTPMKHSRMVWKKSVHDYISTKDFK